jgi:hypothetical protein
MELTVILQTLLGAVQGCTRFLKGKNILNYVRYEVLSAVAVKSIAFWDVVLSSLVEVYRRFGSSMFL